MNLMPYVSAWAALALVVLVLAVYRMILARREEPTTSLHVAAGALEVPGEALTEKRLTVVDRWGQILTIIGVLYGLVLAGIYLYHVWVETAQIPKS